MNVILRLKGGAGFHGLREQVVELPAAPHVSVSVRVGVVTQGLKRGGVHKSVRKSIVALTEGIL